MSQWKTAYLALGSNLGDPKTNVLTAFRELDNQPTIEVQAVSSLYLTKPVGLTDQPDFVNAVAEIKTTDTPEELLASVLHLENLFGRVRTVRWGPRVIDIDVLLYDNAIITTPGLTVPHPRMTERSFVLIPLQEIAPNVTIPGEEKTIQNLIDKLPDSGNISVLEFVTWSRALGH